MVSKGKWYWVYDRELDRYHIYARQEKATDIWITEVETKANANLIVAAVNACKAINPDNPQAVADEIEGMYEAIGQALVEIEDGSPHHAHLILTNALNRAWR